MSCKVVGVGYGGVGVGGSKQLERLPDSIIGEILQRLDLESLCAVACVSTTLRSFVSRILSSLSSIDLSFALMMFLARGPGPGGVGASFYTSTVFVSPKVETLNVVSQAFSLDSKTLDYILRRFRGVKNFTIDCLRLNDSPIIKILGPHVQELHLLKGSLLSYSVFTLIPRHCPNLRVLALELKGQQSPGVLRGGLVEILKNLLSLESLSIKIRGTELDIFDLESVDMDLPKSLKSLKLQPVSEQGVINLMHRLCDGENISRATSSFSIPSSHLHLHFELQHLSLVLDVISDELIISIVNTFPLLVELNLEDRPYREPSLHHDLTNNGVQSLRSFYRLTTLSIVRSRLNYHTSFKRINDLGFFLLSEKCTALESVRLAGFSRVTDAGFSSLLHCCKTLKKFEVRDASQLSDLALNNISVAAGSLVELKLLSCRLITNEAVEQPEFGITLEVLELYGCRSISDACLSYLACFGKLVSLNLGGTDVTDAGLAVLGNGSAPITQLSLRSCRGITDDGISLLLLGEGTMRKTLSSLDVSYMPSITDKAIVTIASAGEAITELCMRNCFSVTDRSLKVLASERRLLDGGSRLLKRLDIYQCRRLTVELVGCLQKPSFRNLRWLGAGLTSLANEKDELALICHERPWLTICIEGCEIGCHDGWQFH